MKHTLWYILLLTILGTSCQMESNGVGPKPKALGRMNEIVVVSDKDMWNSNVGDSIRYYYESAYPMMPAPEPLFDLRHFSTRDLTNQPMRKELRTYLVVANMRDTSSYTTQMVIKDMGSERYQEFLRENKVKTSYGKDKWANGQALFYVLGNSYDQLAASIKSSFPAIASKVRDHDRKQLDASIYTVRGVNMGISNVIKERYNLDVRIPQKYNTVIDNKEDNILWLRSDNPDAIQNIVFFEEEYKNEKQVSKAYIIDKVNAFGKEYVESTDSESYLVINEDHLPIKTMNTTIGESYTKEYRGIWEMTEDFYGGPFFLYATIKDDKVRYIFCFVLAPDSDKRDYMMQLEHIVKNPSF